MSVRPDVPLVAPNDPAFPALHGRPDRGWVNDPNGCAFLDGRYHVFFQHNPDSARHDRIVWGHASTRDLVVWRQEPVALRPRPGEPDEIGCWTGCVLDHDGVPTAVYSGVADSSGRSSVLLARGDRELRHWEQGSKAVAPDPDDLDITDVRDPFVLEVGGRRYAIQGAGRRYGRPQVLAYSCDDLERWTSLGPLLTAADPVAAEVAPAHIWECPNLVPLGDRWVLVVSLWRDTGESPLQGVRYLVGDLTAGTDTLTFAPTAGGELDTGSSFYAPQLLLTEGRVLLWGWAQEDRAQQEQDGAGWSGVLTAVREISLDGDVLVSRPAPELVGLRRGFLDLGPDRPVDERSFEVELGPGVGTLSLVEGGDHPGGQETVVSRWDVSADPLQVPRVLVDGSIVEVFDGGPRPCTVRAYPTATSRWVLRGEPPRAAWRLGLPDPS